MKLRATVTVDYEPNPKYYDTDDPHEFDNYMSRGCPECEDERIARRVLALMRRDAEAAAQINASTEEEPT